MHMGAVMHPAASKAVLAKPLDVQKSAADLPPTLSAWVRRGGGGEMLVIHVTICIK